jgi:hypothetical protein
MPEALIFLGGKINGKYKIQISENKKIIFGSCGHFALAFACRFPFVVQQQQQYASDAVVDWKRVF